MYKVGEGSEISSLLLLSVGNDVVETLRVSERSLTRSKNCNRSEEKNFFQRVIFEIDRISG